MKIENQCGVVPFYSSLSMLRTAQPGQDILPFGLLASTTRLIPFQVKVPAADAGTLVFKVKSIVGASEYTLPASLLNVEIAADNSAAWVSYFGGPLGQTLDIGYWYLEVQAGAKKYYSDVLMLQDFVQLEGIAMRKTNCLQNNGSATFSFSGADAIIGAPSSEVLEYWNGTTWVGFGAATGSFTISRYLGTVDVRRRVTTNAGNTFVATYRLTWASDTPCTNTLALLTYTETIDLDECAAPAWRVTFANAGNIESALYQTGWAQWILAAEMVADVPELEQEEEKTLNGFGEEVRTSSRVYERVRFDIPDIPDYALFPIMAAANCDTVKIQNLNTGDELTLKSVNIGFRKQGVFLNVVTISGRVRKSILAGCAETITLQ